MSFSHSLIMMADTNETSNYILTDDDWDQLIASVDVEQLDRDEAEANLRAENWLRADLEIPENEDVTWETVARYSQKKADKNQERIQEAEEQQRQFELYLQEIRDSREREMFIIELYEKYGPMRIEE